MLRLFIEKDFELKRKKKIESIEIMIYKAH